MDIKFLRELEQYKKMYKKCVNHLCYLTDECVIFSLSNESITENTKPYSKTGKLSLRFPLVTP